MIRTTKRAQNLEPTGFRWAFVVPGGTVFHGGVFRDSHDDPPTNWSPFPAARLTDDIYYGWPDSEGKPWFYHWCTERNLWRGAGTGGHDLVSREPLHLEPSLLWPCCNLHGWCRNSEWTPA